jgi:hypothetical protein
VPTQGKPLPVPDEAPRGAIARFLYEEDTHKPEPAGGHAVHEQTYPWWKVLWLTGMDYFSTLGYQPGIAFLAAGALSPLATGILLVVTLLGALPIYSQVARSSYAGQGSISMLESLLPGWKGKIFVLALLGFASTDFVITMTLSAADAAQHAVENPLIHQVVGDHKMGVTLLLLALLAAVFLRGFQEAIGLAVMVGVPYVLLNLVVMGVGIADMVKHPAALDVWRHALTVRGDWTALFVASIFIFPKLALGMSGFETGVSVMPLIEGGDGELKPGQAPVGRIAATRKLMLAAALLMGVMLMGSAIVTTVMIPAAEFEPHGRANGRALAYLAHELLGEGFGTVYDFSTIAILWFAGASAMAGLLNLIPRYLPRFGMAPRWVLYKRPLILLLFGVDVLVTVVFKADVDAQGGAYATGVLVLMTSAAVAVALLLWKEARPKDGPKVFPLKSLYFWLLTGVFTYTTVDNVIERPDGVIIASIFIVTILVLSGISRYQRATELRVEHFTFFDQESQERWEGIRGKKVNLVPIEHLETTARKAKASEIRRFYRVDGPIAFIHVELNQDRSHFTSALNVRIQPEGADLLITVTGAVAIANAIAYVSEQTDPISIFLELTRMNPMGQAFSYLLWGEGETGLMVYEILVHYWDWTPEEDVRPLIFLMSS